MSLVSQFLRDGKELRRRIRSDEGTTLSKADLEVLRDELRTLHNETVNRLTQKSDGKVNDRPRRRTTWSGYCTRLSQGRGNGAAPKTPLRMALRLRFGSGVWLERDAHAPLELARRYILSEDATQTCLR